MRSIICFVFVLFAAISANAQVTQKGVVKEYNEKAQKTPLAGVELNVRSANSTVSDKNGNFSLNFLTLKAGDRINVRDIKKGGFEIFNKDALEQWNLNPNAPFSIVMCRSDKFKAICDNYYSKASVNYKKQYNKEISAVNKLKKEGKLKDEEYSKKLTEIQENYDRQLDNLDKYVDRLARIDLSEISDQIQHILNLVNEGKVEDAVKIYDDLNLLNKFMDIYNQKEVITSAINQLEDEKNIRNSQIEKVLIEIGKQIDCLYYAGKFAYKEKILELCKRVADTDTTNFKFQIKTGLAYRDLFYDNITARMYFQKALNLSLANRYVNNFDVATCYELLGGTYSEQENQENFDKALEYLKNSLKNYRIIYKNEPSLKEANCYNNIGIIFHKRRQYDKALYNYQQALNIQENSSNVVAPQAIARSYNNIGSLYSDKNMLDSALFYLNRSLNLRLKVGGENTKEVALCYNNIGGVYGRMNEEKALSYFEKAMQIQESILDSLHPDLAQTYNNVGIEYYKKRDYIKALEFYNKALFARRTILGENSPVTADTYNNIGWLNYYSGNFAEAKINLKKATDIYKRTLGTNHEKTIRIINDYKKVEKDLN